MSDAAPSAVSASGAPSPQVALPEVDENVRIYYHGTVQTRAYFSAHPNFLYLQKMWESIICWKTISSSWHHLSGVRKNTAVLVMCIIFLAIDFMPYINTLKWIDNTSWWASVLGIVLVHYLDGPRWNENIHPNIVSILFIVLMALVCWANSMFIPTTVFTFCSALAWLVLSGFSVKAFRGWLPFT